LRCRFAIAASNFKKRSHLFIGSDNETLSAAHWARPASRFQKRSQSSPPRHRSAFKHRCKGVQLGIQRTHLGTFLFGWHRDIGDVYIHSGLIPSMQLRGAAYYVFEFRRNVDHFIALAFCKANAGFSSRSG